MAYFYINTLQNGSTYFKKSMGGDYQCPHCGYQRSSNNVWAPVLHDVIKLFIHFLIYLFRMAKGNMLQADARGRVGQVVFKVLKGQQITSKYQSNVANPKTTAQMQQRARFANAVKFYKHATQNFFKFAYEDKRKTESDFNAFMRHNLTNGNSIILPKDLVDGTFPALAKKWILTSGRLSNAVTVDLAFSAEDNEYYLRILNANGENIDNASDITTVGQFSAFLKDQNVGVIDGDIITIVTVYTSVDSITSGNPESYPQWSVTQFLVNSDDVRELSQFNIKSFNDSLAVVAPQVGDVVTKTQFGAICITRNTDSGLLCNNAVLVCNNSDLIDAAVSAESTSISTWKPTQSAILKGSLATSAVSLKITSPAAGSTVTIGASDSHSVTVQGTNLQYLSDGLFTGGSVTISEKTSTTAKLTFDGGSSDGGTETVEFNGGASNGGITWNVTYSSKGNG